MAVNEFDIPDLDFTLDYHLLARLADAHVSWLIDNNNPAIIDCDAKYTKYPDGTIGLVGTWGDRDHRCGLYFGPDPDKAREKAEEDLKNYDNIIEDDLYEGYFDNELSDNDVARGDHD